MSGEHAARLRRRARAFLVEAEETTDTILAMFFLEQAAQLYIKSVYYELFGAPLRGHGLLRAPRRPREDAAGRRLPRGGGEPGGVRG